MEAKKYGTSGVGFQCVNIACGQHDDRGGALVKSVCVVASTSSGFGSTLLPNSSPSNGPFVSDDKLEFALAEGWSQSLVEHSVVGEGAPSPLDV